MKPRTRVLPDAVPERLARFVASEWPDSDSPIDDWHSARFRFAAETWPGALGDPVERMREWRESKRRRAR
jgi:hypothetical protein